MANLREIKFRGKRLNYNELVFGNYYEYNGKHIIFHQDHSDNATTDHFYEVNPETINQFTGLLDKKGNPIYEGDIVEYDGDNYEIIYSERFAEFRFKAGHSLSHVINLNFENPFELIGNIHEHKHLL